MESGFRADLPSVCDFYEQKLHLIDDDKSALSGTQGQVVNGGSERASQAKGPSFKPRMPPCPMNACALAFFQES